MAADNGGLLAMSLDDIIDKNKKDRRNQRGKKPNGPRPSNKPSNNRNRGPRSKIAAKGPATIKPLTVGSTKIVVSNLAFSVSENDVRQLFGQIGPVRTAQLNYDANGKSKGVATIIFKRPGDAERAIKEYNNRTLDNKPMRIEVILNPTVVASTLNKVNAVNNRIGNKKGVQIKSKTTAGKKAAVLAKKKGPKPSGPKSSGPKSKPKPKSQDELDAEIAAYMSSNPAAQSAN